MDNLNYASFCSNYGDLLLITANFQLLLRLLYHLLKWYSQQPGELGLWSKNIIDRAVIPKFLAELKTLVNDICYNHISSSTAKALRCEITNKNNVQLVTSFWLTSPNHVPANLREANNTKIVNATIEDVINQIIIRISKITSILFKNKNCAFDYTMYDTFMNYQQQFTKYQKIVDHFSGNLQLGKV